MMREKLHPFLLLVTDGPGYMALPLISTDLAFVSLFLIFFIYQTIPLEMRYKIGYVLLSNISTVVLQKSMQSRGP